jgi:hypothetical protein
MTYSTDDIDNNIDVLNMISPPSIPRSKELADMCEKYQLSDPYRALHPHERDYTYIPRTGKNNRSRIDFFLISDSLIPIVNLCTISPSLDTVLFDHKSIHLSFQKPIKSSKNFIDPVIFKHERFEAVVAVAVAETYLQHASTDPDLDLEAGLTEVGNIISKIREANEAEFEIFFEDNSENKKLHLAGLNAEIRMLVEDLPGPQMFNTIRLSCNNDVFLEVLLGNIRNALVSFQTWLKKVRNCKAASMMRQLNILKGNYVENQVEIFNTEKCLSELRDEELKVKISNLKIFENLHNERPSPLFLSLIRNKSHDKLTGICDDNGREFLSDKLRNNHIVEHYEKVYRKRKDYDNVDYDNCIVNFLGQDIINSDLVRNSVLTHDEKLSLDSRLTIEELDRSLEKANMKSSPGHDGFSNVLIKHCWKYLRYPLFNYANHCFETGILTQNFRSAVIKLIPKKGDIKNLKNWRPISLLSNMYKIISRAITARLTKINNRICSRAQKGYNDKRYVQEVLINVCETIQYCRSSGTRAGILAVDMAKAFDSLDHRFIDQVYKFFGFGDNIIRWLRLLGNSRQACISLDNNINSRYFDLGSGRPQGDNISPVTFNFCEQILIFKLELDPILERIPRNNPMINIAADPFMFEEPVSLYHVLNCFRYGPVLLMPITVPVPHSLHSFLE